MADVGKVYPTEIHLLRKELEVQGELLNQERLDRKAEVDRLKLELETLKLLIDQLNPGFMQKYAALYNQEKQAWNPELEKQETATKKPA